MLKKRKRSNPKSSRLIAKEFENLVGDVGSYTKESCHIYLLEKLAEIISKSKDPQLIENAGDAFSEFLQDTENEVNSDPFESLKGTFILERGGTITFDGPDSCSYDGIGKEMLRDDECTLRNTFNDTNERVYNTNIIKCGIKFKGTVTICDIYEDYSRIVIKGRVNIDVDTMFPFGCDWGSFHFTAVKSIGKEFEFD